ncbi:MAG: trypsin-like serine protease, partial [Epulopiscium sp.]|nr:trypsin-like serine protease [Candidatus Epulonipiscium sp.]
MKTFSSKIIRVLFTFCMALLFTMTKNVSAENAISVYLNQKPVTFSASPIVRDNRVLVPARDMFEAMAYQVNWNHATDTVSITKDITTITLKIGSNIALKNDVSIPLDVAPINFNGKTYIPLRFVAENTSADVKWNEAARTIYITTSASNENRLLQSVVKIQTNKIQGSGIILSTDGYIATNFHVLENATTGQIQFQNGEYYNGNITLVGYDTVKDIAIIKINMTGLVPVIFAKSNELHINNPVTAIGSPGGNLNVVSKGVVIGTRDYIIATTAAIRHGSSGGALFNQNGQLIGMTSSFGGESYYSIPARF